MRNRRVVNLFFAFIILFFVSFSLGLVVGKRLAGTHQETQVRTREKEQDPWALSRESGGTKEETEIENEELTYQTPVPTPTGGVNNQIAEPDVGKTPEVRGEKIEEESLAQVTPTPLERSEEREGIAGNIREEESLEEPERSETRETEESETAAAPATLSEGRYTIQIGSFKIESQAQKITEGLKSKGYPAFIKRAEIPGSGTWHRVRVGTFQTREEARLYGEDIKSREPALKSVFITVNN